MEELVLADGTRIDTSCGEVIEELDDLLPGHELPETWEAPITLRRMSELPASVEEMKMIAQIIIYSLMGVFDEEISSTLGITEKELNIIRTLDVFKTVHQEVTDRVLDRNVDSVRSQFVAHSHRAVTTVVGLMASKDKKIALGAAKDILDRAGHRPADVVEHRKVVSGGLEIVHVHRHEGQAFPKSRTIEHNGDM